MSTPPHFICIGAQKAGTTWLYDQAKSHPGIWMPPIKELRYLATPGNLKKRAKTLLETHLAQLRQKDIRMNMRKLRFLHFASRIRGNTVSMDEYVGLFDAARGLVSGDISPEYAVLSEEMIKRTVSQFPDCRFLFLIRDPADRLWSQINMLVREDRMPEHVLTNFDSLQDAIRRPILIKYSYQSETIRRWLEIAGPDRFRVFLFDDLVSRPIEFRRAVLSYIGIDSDACGIAADFNRKTSEKKGTIPAEFKTFLISYFKDEYAELKQLLGGATLAWPSGANMKNTYNDDNRPTAPR